MGLLDDIGDLASGAAHFVTHHWKTIAVTAGALAVGVGATVLTGGALGVPALAALGGGVLGGGGLAGAGAFATGLVASSLTSTGLSAVLDGTPFSVKRFALNAALSVGLGFGTLGVGRLAAGVVAPLVASDAANAFTEAGSRVEVFPDEASARAAYDHALSSARPYGNTPDYVVRAGATDGGYYVRVQPSFQTLLSGNSRPLISQEFRVASGSPDATAAPAAPTATAGILGALGAASMNGARSAESGKKQKP